MATAECGSWYRLYETLYVTMIRSFEAMFDNFQAQDMYTSFINICLWFTN